jgi:DNA polymerase III epsilon subunit-like protein
MEKIILDTETTGLRENDEIIEICLINMNGEILLNTLIKPTIAIPEGASEIHGIYDKDVENAPLWSEVYQDFINIIKNKEVNIYNKSFDIKMINQTSKKYGLRFLIGCYDPYDTYIEDEYDIQFHFHCVMQEYADIFKRKRSF